MDSETWKLEVIKLLQGILVELRGRASNEAVPLPAPSPPTVFSQENLDSQNTSNGEVHKVEKVSRAKPKHSFEKSVYYDFEKFREALSDWPEAKCKYFYNQAVLYSGSKDVQYSNWAMAVQKWDYGNPSQWTTYASQNVKRYAEPSAGMVHRVPDGPVNPLSMEEIRKSLGLSEG